MLGIDTASVADNKNINWQQARAGGITFAILRAAYGAKPDSAFGREWRRVADAGIVRGAYLFWRATRDWKEQLRLFLSVASLAQGDFPPVIDVEFPGKGISETGLSAAEALDIVGQMCAYVREEEKILPLIYTSARVWKEDLKNRIDPKALLPDCPLWLARYPYKAGAWRLPPAGAPPVPTPWGGTKDPTNWWFWQYQGDAKKAPGFPSGNVDMNVFNPMIQGARGGRVKWLQRRLGITVDGSFGPMTEKALRQYQGLHGLVMDGVVGPRTFAYLAWED